MKALLILILFFCLCAIGAIPTRSFAITHGATPLGGRCTASHECAWNMGCRKSNLGGFFVCKITVPTTSGCAVNAGENMCADGLVCEDNRCVPTYGLEDLENGKFTIPIEPPEENPVFAFPGDIPPLRAYATLSTARKIVTTLLAFAFFIGLTAIAKGVLTYTTAIGFIPQERRGFALLGIGSALAVGSIVVWLVVW